MAMMDAKMDGVAYGLNNRDCLPSLLSKRGYHSMYLQSAFLVQSSITDIKLLLQEKLAKFGQ